MTGSIVKHIVDGAIRFDSVEKLEAIVAQHPQHPALRRVFGDLLRGEREEARAAENYGQAAKLFLAAQAPLKALTAKVLQWQLIKPSRPDAWAFYSAFREGRFAATPVQAFFSGLGYAEFVAVIMRLDHRELDAERTLLKFGDAEESLNFIVSGALAQTTFLPLNTDEKSQRREMHYLAEDDFFGRIHPPDGEFISQSLVRTLTAVELLSLSKGKLKRICEKFPDLPAALRRLYPETSSEEAGPLRKMRKARRHKLSVSAEVHLYPDESGKSPRIFYGHSMDLSMGGASVILDAHSSADSPGEVTGKTVKLRVRLPNEAVSMSILGTVIWCRQVRLDDHPALQLGLQYKEMPPKLGGFLVLFADILCTVEGENSSAGQPPHSGR